MALVLVCTLFRCRVSYCTLEITILINNRRRILFLHGFTSMFLSMVRLFRKWIWTFYHGFPLCLNYTLDYRYLQKCFWPSNYSIMSGIIMFLLLALIHKFHCNIIHLSSMSITFAFLLLFIKTKISNRRWHCHSVFEVLLFRFTSYRWEIKINLCKKKCHVDNVTFYHGFPLCLNYTLDYRYLQMCS